MIFAATRKKKGQRLSGPANFLVPWLFKALHTSSTMKGVKKRVLVTDLLAELYAGGLPSDTVLNKEQEATKCLLKKLSISVLSDTGMKSIIK